MRVENKNDRIEGVKRRKGGCCILRMSYLMEDLGVEHKNIQYKKCLNAIHG